MFKYIQDGRVLHVHSLEDCAKHLANNFEIGNKSRVQVKAWLTPSRERALTAAENQQLLARAQEIVADRRVARDGLLEELREGVARARQAITYEEQEGEDL